MLLEGEDYLYEANCLIYYRYFSLTPGAITEKYVEFYKVLDKYFMDKFNIGDEKSTREGIQQIFAYPSERVVLINEETLDSAMETYKKNPLLLATKKEKIDAIIESMYGTQYLREMNKK